MPDGAEETEDGGAGGGGAGWTKVLLMSPTLMFENVTDALGSEAAGGAGHEPRAPPSPDPVEPSSQPMPPLRSSQSESTRTASFE